MAQGLPHPYIRLMRLHQPIGAWLLFWPCAWAVMLAGGGKHPWLTILLFALGAFLMRASGCIINDLTDRKFDRAVERTRTRPLVSGEISVKESLFLLAVLLMLSFGVAWCLGIRVVVWSLAAMPLVIVYPWMKRITGWPQAFLGLTFNWGALVGWVAVRGTVEWPALLLYAAGFFWTLGYDTIYAHQDIKDDALIGVRSTALTLGPQSKIAISGFYGACVIFLALCGMATGASTLFYAFLLLVAADFACQLRQFNRENPANAGRIFKSNARTGLIIFCACLLGAY